MPLYETPHLRFERIKHLAETSPLSLSQVAELVVGQGQVLVPGKSIFTLWARWRWEYANEMVAQEEAEYQAMEDRSNGNP